jgi:diaminohydroxyphosphoribosylaminopyrimidine deaminase/5-amino-6-(5-phosphoribosylamino)uracil reductase
MMALSRFMRMALALAKKADPFPNPRVGAVIVRRGRVLGSGYHKGAGMPHAEIMAIDQADSAGGDIRGATLYVTMEPCSHKMKRTPPCTLALIRRKIKKVVFGMRDRNPLVDGSDALKKAGVKVEGPVAQKEGEAMNRRYLRHYDEKPFVAIKMAMSADGKTATRTGDSKWISGPKEREYVHRMRSEYGAVIVGAETVIKDNPALTSHGKGRDPLRIVVDGRLRIPIRSRILAMKDGKTIIAVSERAPEKKIKKIALHSGAHVFVCGKSKVDLRALTHALAAMGIRKILIEGGSELNAEALKAGIADKLILVVAPKIIGGRRAKPVIGGDGIERMGQAIPLKNSKIRKMGKDLLLEYEISRSSGK